MNKLKNIKDPGFKAPKDYFDDLEDAVFSKLNTEQIQGKVDDHGFTMPKDYLDSIENKIFSKLDSDDNNVKVVSLFNKRNLLYISGIAAAVVIMFSVFMNKNDGSSEELDYELVENYILDQNISSYELASLLTNEELLEVNSGIMDEAFGDDSLEDYLLENANIEDIIEQ
jgi:hypothetical protein